MPIETLEETPVMSREQTETLIKRFQTTAWTGKDALRNQVIEGNLRLIRKVANRYKFRMEFEDAVQVASQAMMRACDDFDPKEGQFSTYAVKCMKTKLNREVENMANTVRLPSAEQNLIREYKRVFNMLRSSLNRDPYTDEVADILVHHKEIADINKELRTSSRRELISRRTELLSILGRKKALVSQPNWTHKMAEEVAKLISNHTGSIDSVTGDSDNECFALIRSLKDERLATPEETMDMEEACGALQSAMAELTDREKDVIRMRFFEEMTLDEVAKKIVNEKTGDPLTRERVRQIESSALLILRAYLLSFGTDARKVIQSIALHATQNA